MLVATTYSGSMTQEVFYLFAEHFIKSLPKDHGPVILLLDGHGSRWSVQALKLLWDNGVYCFFIASHTSIWAQPNDAGTNKRLHWAVEQVARKFRRLGAEPNVKYFNRLLCLAWELFLKTESDDLRANGMNNTTNSYERTGMFPFNPYASAWTEAIETLGLGNDENVRAKVQFEIIAKQKPPELTVLEKEVLRAGLELDSDNNFGDSALALIRGEEILKKWRLAIEEGVSKGEKYEEYAKTLLPSGVLGMSDAMKIALKLVTFEIVDISKVQLPAKKTKEEKAREFTVNVINSTKIAMQPVEIAYLSSSSSDSDKSSDSNDSNESSDDEAVVVLQKWVEETAIKLSETKWQVILSDGSILATEQDN